jgi:hypothetical protein
MRYVEMKLRHVGILGYKASFNLQNNHNHNHNHDYSTMIMITIMIITQADDYDYGYWPNNHNHNHWRALTGPADAVLSLSVFPAEVPVIYSLTDRNDSLPEPDRMVLFYCRRTSG